MKQSIAIIIFLIAMAVTSCTSYDAEMDTYDVSIALTADSTSVPDSCLVTLRNSLGATFSAYSDTLGNAHFRLPAGIYQGNASGSLGNGNEMSYFNGSISDVVVGNTGTGNAISASIPLIVSKISRLVIKEIYVGGCQKDDGSGVFANDKCIILYNNSAEAMSLDNIAFGMIEPYNAEAGTHSFLSNGALQYADEDWIPAINGIWYFQDGQQIAPYSELVVNVSGAIDHTGTYSNSINYANPDYYCMYDPSYIGSDGVAYANTSYYPSPSEVIPTLHYLKTVKYGKGNAWPLSTTSPAVILFKTTDTTPKDYAENAANIIYPSSQQNNLVYACLKVKRSWVLDAVEVYNDLKSGDCKKRLTPDLDNGYVLHTRGYGHALIRNVGKSADGHTIYMDTNNSTNDFYEAPSCSLK